MTSYFSSLTSSSAISNLGTRLNSLRRAITSGDEADDPENEDCSHISNVLRAYYTEKGRPFPPWLPPDPKSPAPTPSRIVATSQLQQQPGQAATTPGYGRGGLSDLWGDSAAASQPLPSQTSSLRRGRGTPGVPLSGTQSAPPAPVPQQSQTPPPSMHPAGARPLPSQRAGSYQTTQSARLGTERTGSAQERLRARLHGGRSPSPNPGQNPYGGADPSARKPVGLPSNPRLHGSR